MKRIALIGAGGKIGCRITDNLRHMQFDVRYIENGRAGIENLEKRGLSVTPVGDGVEDADFVILAVPDRLIGKIAGEIVPVLKQGCLVITLDPAAGYGGAIPKRNDIAYFIVHPCHPPVINDETDPDAKMDFFGGIKAKQNIVCALLQGSEQDYSTGERIARGIFAPVMNAHRVTVEQMVMLEPAMAETVTLTLMFVMMEAMEETVKAGVPREAARDFLLGHININLGILFGYCDARFSDGAMKMVERAKKALLQPDWKDVFKPDSIMREVKAIITGA
jgi:hypothetical protein